MDTAQYWNKIYETKAENEVSWFQQYPKTSMELFESFNLPLTANIVDVGGGDSHFAEVVLDKGYKNISVLDVSANVIGRAKQRLGERASQINWIISDITTFNPSLQFDLWHDRAVLHFLTAEEDANKYVSIAESAIRQNGYLVIGTFSENGPEKCSGLPIKKYSEISMTERFKKSFEKIKCFTEDHLTPFNTKQNFLFCCFKRK